MNLRAPTLPLADYRRLPKVDLHRHLEGSLRVGTLMEISRHYGLTLPLQPGLSALVQIQPGEPRTSTNFLSKFAVLRLFYRSPEVIARITREAVLDAALDNVRYLDLHFTPVALSRAQGFDLGEVMDWVAAAARQAAQETGTIVRLIASVNRHESVELAESVVREAAARRSDGIIGLDLAGNETDFSAAPFAPLFREARQSGLQVVAHAGEWGGAENVRQALVDLEAARIIHGVRIVEDPYVTALARERDVPFAVCLTSNLQTGVATSADAHPIRQMLAYGLNVTLNTDDPGISDITLADDYALAVETLGLSRPLLANRILAAAQAAFLPESEKQALINRLREELRGA